MTTKEKLIDWLTSNGMWPDQAQKVFEKAKPSLESDDYRITWDRPADEYPDAFYAVLIMTLRPIALAWIDENCPQAWFRPMFCEDPEAELARLQASTQEQTA